MLGSSLMLSGPSMKSICGMRLAKRSPSCCAMQPATPITRLGLARFSRPMRPDLTAQLLLRLFADAAGVQQHQVGVGRLRDLGIANAAQHLADSVRIVLVHLAAKSDERIGGHGEICREIPAGRQASTARRRGTYSRLRAPFWAAPKTACFPEAAPTAKPKAA